MIINKNFTEVDVSPAKHHKKQLFTVENTCIVNNQGKLLSPVTFANIDGF